MKKNASELVLTQKAEPGKAPISAEPHMGDVRVVDGEKQVCILGFGWDKDEAAERQALSLRSSTGSAW